MPLMSARIAAASAACLLGLTSVSLATAASGDSLAGSGRLSIGGAHLWLSVGARSGPSGEDPDGTIRIDETGTHTFSGVADVLCLEVSGSEATVVGRLRRPVANPSEPGTTYQYILVSVTDNGMPGGTPDTMNSGVTWGTPGGAFQPSCSGFLGGASIDSGNVTVVDAAP